MVDYKCPKNKHTKWLIMVYMAGDNNLSPQSIAYLQELEDAVRNRNVRVVAGFDPSMPVPRGARYVEIKRHLEPGHPYYQKKMDWPLHNDLLSPGHVVVSPDFCKTHPTTLFEPVAKEAFARFLDWVKKCYEADHYMLILFGHGPLVAGNTFLSDSTPPSYLKLKDFANILKKHFGRKIDILGCDNCVMNGIETAVQLHGQVDYMIGSQSLMLINGWPFRKIIEEVGKKYKEHPKVVADAVLEVCARSLLNFTLMDRSSEQAICDVNKFGRKSKLVKAVKQLSTALQDGLRFYEEGPPGELRYPMVRDVVRLARLEAQAYWAETFVDLYDFCELLLLRCNDVLCNLQGLAKTVMAQFPAIRRASPAEIKQIVLTWPSIQKLEAIAKACEEIIGIFQNEHVVTRSYYVCSQLQYSHGVSIYFPWTLPEGPITFDREWTREPIIKRPFDEYKDYEFGKSDCGDWTCTLEAFFRATLRNVRRVEYEYKPDTTLFFKATIPEDPGKVELSTPAIDLLKSGHSGGPEDEFDYLQIKNYPRRFYLSPADCDRRMQILGPGGEQEANKDNVIAKPGEVSYLGWNIRGFMAKVIGLPPGKPFPDENPTCPELNR
jgi:Clostripain family